VNKKVFVSLMRNGATRRAAIDAGFSFTGFDTEVRPDARVFVKPNLTWRQPMPGVTTSPGFLLDFLTALKERVRHVIVGESNGGYHSFAAEEAFESHGLTELARRLGIQVVNLSNLPVAPVRGRVNGREVEVDLPRFLFEEVDTFITAPVPKIHSNTGVSIALKNQWGCIPDSMRLRMHHRFAETLSLVNRTVGLRYAFCDASTMLDRTGPMVGEPVAKDLLIASNDAGAASMIACRIMRIDPWSIHHQRVAQTEGQFPARDEAITLNDEIEPYQDHQFTLHRNVLNWVSKAAFHSSILTALIYDSWSADVAHKILYSVRRQPIVARILYAEWGPPSIEGKRS
jgi:uncharacterized protein (DUF362 family)